MEFDEQPHIILSEPFTAEGKSAAQSRLAKKSAKNFEKLRKMQLQERMRKTMNETAKKSSHDLIMEFMDEHLQVYKRTGEIKTCGKPQYRGRYLDDVYSSYSSAKKQAYQNCMDTLYFLSDDYAIESYGITSKTGWSFTFAAVFGACDIKYVIWFSSDRNNYSYWGENSCGMNIKIYLLEEN